MYSIKVRENILIAHSLPGEVFGPAQNMHGATYLVDAEFFTDKLNKYNIIMDLGVVSTTLKDILKKIYHLGIRSLLIEGGDKITNSFIKNNLFNEFYLFKSPNKLSKKKKYSSFTSLKLLNKKYDKTPKIRFKLFNDIITIYEK